MGVYFEEQLLWTGIGMTFCFCLVAVNSILNFDQEVYIEPLYWNALSFVRFIIPRRRNLTQAVTILIHKRDVKFKIAAGTRIEKKYVCIGYPTVCQKMWPVGGLIPPFCFPKLLFPSVVG